MGTNLCYREPFTIFSDQQYLVASCASNSEDWSLAHSNEQVTTEHFVSVWESLINTWFNVTRT